MLDFDYNERVIRKMENDLEVINDLLKILVLHYCGSLPQQRPTLKLIEGNLDKPPHGGEVKVKVV
jgi:hypothetical protein